MKYYSLVPKCVDFPDGEVREAKSLKLPYQFNNDDDIERLFGKEKPTFKPRVPVEYKVPEPEINYFETEAETNSTEPFYPIEGPNDFMFNDFEIIGGQVSYEDEQERKQEPFEEYEATEENLNGQNEENLFESFDERKKTRQQKSICEKLKYKNPGMFYIFRFLKFYFF